METEAFLENEKRLENISPLETVGYLNRYIFKWMNRVIGIGRKRFLKQEDIFGLRSDDKCYTNYNRLIQIWDIVIKDPQVKNPLKETIWQAYRISQSSQVLQGVAISRLIEALTEDDPWPMAFASSALFISNILTNNLQALYQFEFTSSALNVFIAEKTLNYPIIRSPLFKLGDFLNMLQVDINQATGYFQYYLLIFVTPIFIALVCYLAISTLKDKFPLVAAGSLIQLIFGIVLGYVYGSLQRKFMHGKDTRMRYLDQMMGGIQTIQYNSMQSYFADRIQKKRKYELKRLLHEKLMLFLTSYVNGYLPGILSLIIVYTYEIQSGAQFLILTYYSGMLSDYISQLPDMITSLVVGKNSIRRMEPFLTSEEVLFNQGKLLSKMRSVVANQNNNNNTDSISDSQLTISIKQNDFEKELIKNNDVSVEISNGFFEWTEQIQIDSISQGIKISSQDLKQMDNKESFKIEDINFKIFQGQCIAFVGDIGSGQSSIFYALLGEMNTIDGQNGFNKSVYINGKISIATQDPWIMQGTVRENITFGSDLDYNLYQYVLRFCGLEQDLRQFPESDLTFIGEQGETISGGQKQRINLARSFYNEADIYLFDDPLSALDVQVASFVANEGIVGYLSGQTRIIFSANINHLQKFDRIYYMDKGKIIDIGNYDKIRRQYFSNEANQSLQENKENETEQINLKQPQSDPILSEQFISLQEQTQENNLLIKQDKEDGSVNKQMHRIIFNQYGHFYTLLAGLISLSLVGFIWYYVNQTLIDFSNLDDEVNKKNKDTNHHSEPTDEEIQTYRSLFSKYLIYQQLGGIAIMMFVLIVIAIGIQYSLRLHTEIVDKLLGASFPKFYNIIIQGRLMNRLSKDIFNVDQELPSAITQMTFCIGYFITFEAFFIALGYFQLIPVLVLNISCSLYLVYVYMRSMRQMARIEAVSKSPIISFYTELVRGVVYLRNCIPRKYLIDCHVQNVEVDLRNQIAISGIQSWFINYSALISNICMILMIVIMYLDPNIQTSKITAVVVMFLTVSGDIVKLGNAWISYQVNMINFERCQFLVRNIQQEQEEQIDYVNENLNENMKIKTESNNGKYNAIQNKNMEILNFANASLTYRTNIPPALINAEFKINHGEKIGIVGRTGAGKTTITLGLSKMIDVCAGSVQFKGKDLKQYHIRELRSHISVIPQDPFLFQGTLKENLDPNNLYSLAELKFAIDAVEIQKTNSFKSGLQSNVSINGGNLSLGEQQLVSIARAILRQNQLILIDEVSANMGDESEQLVIKAIQDSFQSCTVLTIAHKIKTILNSDQIIVIDGGKVAEFDSPQNLRDNTNSLFSSIVEAIEKSCGNI